MTTAAIANNSNVEKALYARILGPFSDLLWERDSPGYFFNPNYVRPARPETAIIQETVTVQEEGKKWLVVNTGSTVTDNLILQKADHLAQHADDFAPQHADDLAQETDHLAQDADNLAQEAIQLAQEEADYLLVVVSNEKQEESKEEEEEPVIVVKEII